MTTRKIANRLPVADLGKWPRLLVVGKSVTEAQANEILVRTNSPYLWHTNDKTWGREVSRAFGVEANPIHFMPEWKSMEAIRDRYRMLDLEYLSNHRIMSSWVGGPHGWCDWDGNIACSEFNLGKWPRVEEVDREWRTIAAAFPFLTLEAQLVGDEGEGSVLVGWRVADGKVMLRPRPNPRDYLRPVREAPMTGLIASLVIGGNTRERGVSIERLEVALAQVRESSPSSPCTGQEETRRA